MSTETNSETHSSPRLHIRPGMDVYSAYQDEYIGTVVRVWRQDGQYRTASERGATHLVGVRTPARGTGSSTEAAQNPELTHEEGHTAHPTRTLGSTAPQVLQLRGLGEELGPFPTKQVGNTGPENQSASHSYATESHDPLASVRYFAVRPGRINLGPLTRPLYIPAAAVRSVSMERIVLDVEKHQIPDEWHTRPESLTA